jgi:hypothetical protein
LSAFVLFSDMQTVSHSLKPITMPVDFKLHHYRSFGSGATLNFLRAPSDLRCSYVAQNHARFLLF